MRVVGLELNVLQRGLRRGKPFFVELAAAGTHALVGGVIFPGGFAVGSELLDTNRAAIRIERPLCLIKILFFGEGADDLRWREIGRRFRLSPADNAGYFLLWWSRLRASRTFLRGGAGDPQERSRESNGENVRSDLQPYNIHQDSQHKELE